MFGPKYKTGCPSCSAIADGFNGIAVHPANHDVMLWGGVASSTRTLRRGAKRVYAGTRKLLAHSDTRYTFCVGGDQNRSSRQQVTEFVPDKKVVWHV